MKKTIVFGENGYVVRNEIAEIYRKEMARHKPLTDEEIRELITLAKNGNNRAKEKVINANLRLVWSIASRYNGLDNFMDILQNGNYGLCLAVGTFDVSRETCFTTWALQMIQKYINIGLDNDSRTIRKPKHVDVAVESVSADAPIGNDEGDEKTLLDTIASDFRTDANDEVDAMRVKINYLMKDLKPIEKEVVCGLFGFGCREYTLYELSIKFNLTEERIRQIKMEALKKMQKLG